MDKQYAIDADVFISASRLYYPFDIAPAFWRQLVEKGSNKIVLIDKIKDEILRNEDQLSEWLQENSSSFLIRTSMDPKVIESYRRIISFVSESSHYRQIAKFEFAEAADSWLCAHASAYSYVIVTEERYEPNSRKRVKIPNVCKEFAIDYINRIQFIRELGIKFE